MKEVCCPPQILPVLGQHLHLSSTFHSFLDSHRAKPINLLCYFSTPLTSPFLSGFLPNHKVVNRCFPLPHSPFSYNPNLISFLKIKLLEIIVSTSHLPLVPQSTTVWLLPHHSTRSHIHQILSPSASLSLSYTHTDARSHTHTQLLVDKYNKRFAVLFLFICGTWQLWTFLKSFLPMIFRTLRSCHFTPSFSASPLGQLCRTNLLCPFLTPSCPSGFHLFLWLFPP